MGQGGPRVRRKSTRAAAVRTKKWIDGMTAWRSWLVCVPEKSEIFKPGEGVFYLRHELPKEVKPGQGGLDCAHGVVFLLKKNILDVILKVIQDLSITNGLICLLAHTHRQQKKKKRNN